jgi:hypothetical protein
MNANERKWCYGAAYTNAFCYLADLLGFVPHPNLQNIRVHWRFLLTPAG